MYFKCINCGNSNQHCNLLSNFKFSHAIELKRSGTARLISTLLNKINICDTWYATDTLLGVVAE